MKRVFKVTMLLLPAILLGGLCASVASAQGFTFTGETGGSYWCAYPATDGSWSSLSPCPEPAPQVGGQVLFRWGQADDPNECNFSAFGDKAGNVIERTVPAKSGQCSARTGAGSAGYGKLMVHLQSTHADLWLRGWVYFHSNYPVPCCGGVLISPHLWRFHEPNWRFERDFSTAQGQDVVRDFYFWKVPGGAPEAVRYYPNTFHFASAARRGRWQCWEIRSKLNTPGQSDGVSEFYADGVLIGRHEGLNIRGNTTYGYGKVDIQSNIAIPTGAAMPSTMWWLVDDVVISTARVGCGDAPPPDAPPPAVEDPAPVPAPVPVPQVQGVIFEDDFEDPNSAGRYFEYNNNGGNFVRVAGVGVGGSTGMRARFQAGEVNAGALHLAFGRTPDPYFKPVDAGTQNYREIYWRVYVRNQAGWTGGGGDKLSRATIFAKSNWAQAMVGHVWGGSSPNQNYLLIDPVSGTDTSGNLKTTGYNDNPNLRWLGATRGVTPVFDSAHVGQWQCIEARVRLNDAGQSNGVFQMWINGQLEASRTDLNWVGGYNEYGINALFLENYWNNGSPVTQERYFDNLVVSTQPIGCGVAAPVPPPEPEPPVPVFEPLPSDVEARLAALEGDLINLMTELARLRAENAQLQAQHAALRARLEALLAKLREPFFTEP